VDERSDFINSLVRRRSTAAVASAIPVLITGSACNPGDDEGGFRITRVDFDNNSKITLTFSEPVADLGEVNPNDFRLSLGRTSSYVLVYDGMETLYEYTSYQDLVSVAGGYNYYGTPFTFLDVALGSSASQIVLTTTDPLGPNACDWVRTRLEAFEMYSGYYEDARMDLAIFLHYASGDVPIESQAGVELGEIGPDWVLSGDSYFTREGFGFTMLAPQLRIPCPP
jgi:hypothetical protein